MKMHATCNALACFSAQLPVLWLLQCQTVGNEGLGPDCEHSSESEETTMLPASCQM